MREALSVASHGADLRSQGALLACYLRLLTGSADATGVRVRLRCGQLEHDVSLRRNDIFTMGEVLYERQYQPPLTLPDRPVIVDGGANIGIAALWLLAERPRARLHAFEPEAGNFALLERNLAGLPDVVLNQAALGAWEQTVQLHLSNHGALHSVADAGVGERTRSVPCRRLDVYMHEHAIDTIDLLKLDVEGSEAQVIEGLGDRLVDVRAIVGEFHEALVEERDFFGRLEEAGFESVFRKRYGSPTSPVCAFRMQRPRTPD